MLNKNKKGARLGAFFLPALSAFLLNSQTF